MRKNNIMSKYNKILAGIMFLIILLATTGSMKSVSATETKTDVDKSLDGTITVMMHEGANTMKPYNDAFMRKYPNVKVEYISFDNYEATISEKIKQDDFGDVIFLPSYVEPQILKTKFEPLGEYKELSQKYNYVDRGGRIGDVVYSIPSSAYLSGILYNKDVFEQAGISSRPRSIEEFYDDMVRIKETDDKHEITPFCSYYSTEWALYCWANFPYIEMTGDPSYAENAFLHEEDPFGKGSNSYQVYRLLYDLIKDGLCEKPFGKMSWDESIKNLRQGKLGCVVLGSWAMHQVMTEDGSVTSDNIGFMPFPNEVDGQQYMTVLTEYCIGVSSNSKNKKAALAYVDFLLDESGYAVKQGRISVAKNELLPESYSDLEDVIFVAPGTFNDNNYNLYLELNNKVDPSSVESIKRVMAAAGGKSNESFDDIMKEWNTAWNEVRVKFEKKNPGSVSTEKPKEPVKEEEKESAQEMEEPEAGAPIFAELEKQFIAEHSTIKVGYLTNMAPFQYLNGKNEFGGVSRDVINRIAQYTGWTMEFYQYENTRAVLEALANGEIDIAAGVEKLPVNAKKAEFSRSYISYSEVLVKRESLDKTELSTNNQAVIVGEINTVDYVKANDYVQVNTPLEMLQTIANKKADFAIINGYTAKYYTNEIGDIKLSTVPTNGERELCLAFAKDADYKLTSVCNKCIFAIPDSVIQMNLLEYLEQDQKRITLSRIVQEYPIQAMVSMVAFFALIITVGVVSYRHQKMRMQKNAIEMKKFESLSRLMDEYIFDYDVTGNKIQLDEKFSELCGFSGVHYLLSYAEDNPLIKTIMEQCKNISGDTYTSDPFKIEDVNGVVNWYRMTVFKIEEKGIKNQIQVIGKIINIQEEMESMQDIQEQADRDLFTGLYNRSGFRKQFNGWFEQGYCSKGVTFAVLDLDNFKSVNDTLGHNGGDQALLKLADTLKELQKEGVILGRYGGDEFIVCVFDISLEDAQEMFAALVRRMDTNIAYQGKEKHLSISLGAIYTQTELDYLDLFNAADKVLYDVKENGKNDFRVKSI